MHLSTSLPAWCIQRLIAALHTWVPERVQRGRDGGREEGGGREGGRVGKLSLSYVSMYTYSQ